MLLYRAEHLSKRQFQSHMTTAYEFKFNSSNNKIILIRTITVSKSDNAHDCGNDGHESKILKLNLNGR